MAKTTVISAKKNGASLKALSPNERQEIEKLAYQFFVERGQQHGHDQEDWARAEQVVRSRRS